MRIVDDDGVDVAPGETGEIVVRGDTVTPGYWRTPDVTASAIRDGWPWTGDVGGFDPAGYLSILDRSRDPVVSGGNNVCLREAEDAIVAWPRTTVLRRGRPRSRRPAGIGKLRLVGGGFEWGVVRSRVVASG